LRFNRSEPGLFVSGALHTLALASALVVFSGTQPLMPAEEAIAIDIIVENPTNEITKGERSAKEVTTPKPRAERVAETQQERDPGEAKRDVASPPTRPADMKTDDKPVEASTPPPPLRPRLVEEVKPEPTKSEPPKAEKLPEKKPEPNRQELTKLIEQGEIEARQKEEQAKKELQDKLKEEKLKQAKIEKEKADKEKAEKAKVEAATKVAKEAIAKAKAKADAEAKAAKEAALADKFNAGDIRKLLQSKEAAQSTGSAGREVQRTASLGTATAAGAKLSPSLRSQLIGLLQDQMQKCYSPPIGASTGASTLPLLDIRLNNDGSLMSEPRVVRAGNSAGERAIADAALRAVRRCAPYRVPAAFVPYFNDWKILNVEFEVPSI
jgi:colicin import membrane protein